MREDREKSPASPPVAASLESHGSLTSGEGQERNSPWGKASPELPGLERGSGRGKGSEQPREQMGDCNRAEERRDQAGVTHGPVPPGACSQTLRTPRFKEGRKQEPGGMQHRGHGGKFYPLAGHTPPKNHPWDPLPVTRFPRDEGSGMGRGRGPRAGLSAATPLPNKASAEPFTCRSRPAKVT